MITRSQRLKLNKEIKFAALTLNNDEFLGEDDDKNPEFVRIIIWKENNDADKSRSIDQIAQFDSDEVINKAGRVSSFVQGWCTHQLKLEDSKITYDVESVYPE